MLHVLKGTKNKKWGGLGAGGIDLPGDGMTFMLLCPPPVLAQFGYGYGNKADSAQLYLKLKLSMSFAIICLATLICILQHLVIVICTNALHHTGHSLLWTMQWAGNLGSG